MIREIIPKTINIKISKPAPFPLATLLKRNFVTNGPIIKTSTILRRKAHSQKILNKIASGITANIKPLIQGMAVIQGTAI